MTRVSSNGYPVIESFDDPRLRPWRVGPTVLILRSGPPGFLLAHNALWFHRKIERLWLEDMPDHDDHGYGQRFIGGTSIPSNHWAAVAEDLNARRHPQGTPVEATFTADQAARIRKRLVTTYRGLIGWGGNWRPENVDSMHFELVSYEHRDEVRALAVSLARDTPIGRQLIAAQEKPVEWVKW